MTPEGRPPDRPTEPEGIMSHHHRRTALNLLRPRPYARVNVGVSWDILRIAKELRRMAGR
jgi:hypothetical protein